MSQPIQSCFERYEKKYFLTPAGQKALLQTIAPYIKMDFYGKYTICNLYYDTPDWRLIRASLAKPVYKEKLRVRSYGPAAAGDEVFVELKKKVQGVVYKRRIAMPGAQAEACLSRRMKLPDSQIGREIAYVLDYYRELEPAVFLSYEREAFAERNGGDFRVTFDENIRYRQTRLTLDSKVWGRPVLQPDLVLMELKTSDALPLWMVQALSRQRIFKTSFSKYGVAYQDIVMNNRQGVWMYA